MAFRGEIAEIPVGIDGLTGSKNLAEVGPGSLLVADNLTYEAGTLGKEGGSTIFNSTAISGTPAILGGVAYSPDSTTQRVIVLADDGTLYRDASDNFGTSLKTGLTVSAVNPVFVEGGLEASGS